jgi:cell division protein FtsZ
MIPYSRDPRQTIPSSAVKIIGLGGAGANMLERIALDGMEGSELIALNTDVRTLGASLAKEKIQLGINLTKGLGAGGDPELGHQAVLEAEDAIRAAVKGQRIVFLCTGLGGGTGSGAAPIVTRIAREEGAFVVVFATMPFAFEGKRRRDQAETALNELAVLSNALVTFDNNRMGELVLAKQGIHEAFIAADHMISESIKAVIRLVVRPGLINVGLDDLMSALRTNRSRCLFGSGIAEGKDRASKALRNALASPLLDQGTLLKDAQTVLVHLCGGEDLTLFEIELLMQRLQKFVPESAHVLFGAAIDPAMGESLSLTLISALPEDSLAMAPRESLSQAASDSPLYDSVRRTAPPAAAKAFVPEPEPAPAPPITEKKEVPGPSLISKFRKTLTGGASATPAVLEDERPFAEPEETATEASPAQLEALFEAFEAFDSPESDDETVENPIDESPEEEAPLADEQSPAVVVTEFIAVETKEVSEVYLDADPDPEPIEEEEIFTNEEEAPEEPALESSGFTPLPKKRPPGVAPWGKGQGSKATVESCADDIDDENVDDLEPEAPEEPEATPESANIPKLKLGVKTSGPQSELSFDSSPRGRFEGENPNVVDGEDLDLPPFLRKKK